MTEALIAVAFDPPPGASSHEGISGLAGTAGVAQVAAPVEQALLGEYFDTVDGSLAAAGITLARRESDEGVVWHLKLPGTDALAVDDIVVPVRRRSKRPPKQLLETVRVYVRTKRVSPVTTLHVQRWLVQLLDTNEQQVAEVHDDMCRAEGASGEQRTWRQWEIVLPDGSPEILAAARTRFIAAGAKEIPYRVRLSRLVNVAMPVLEAPPELRKHGPAWPIVHRRLAELVALIKQMDPRVRSDLPESVHELRVASRRLRSLLATFRPFFDRDVTDPVRDELRWIAGLLGEPRDSEVLRERLLGRVAEEPEELVVGPVAQRVNEEFSDRYRKGHTRTVRAMQSDRYFTLIDSLEALIADPPWTASAYEAADKRLRRRVHQDWKQVRSAVEAVPTDDLVHRDLQLHEVRKAAKRARYAAETLVPLYGGDARRFAKANQLVQSVLGEHNDSVVARRELLQVADHAHRNGEDTFSYGRLHALEQAEAVVLGDRFERLWRKVSRRKLRRWLE